MKEKYAKPKNNRIIKQKSNVNRFNPRVAFLLKQSNCKYRDKDLSDYCGVFSRL